jgi:hypothetical protein
LTGCRKAIAVEKELPVEFDLGLLAVYDPNPIEVDLYAFVPSPSPPLIPLLTGEMGIG